MSINRRTLHGHSQTHIRNRRTVEGRLLMGDFNETGYRCRIHPPDGPPVLCTFHEAHKDAVLRALTRWVRVVGEASDTEEALARLDITDIEILPEGTPCAPGAPTSDFERAPSIQEAAREQAVPSAVDYERLVGDFWPNDESADEFIGAVRQWRRDNA